jgi:hypothetical protein
MVERGPSRDGSPSIGGMAMQASPRFLDAPAARAARPVGLDAQSPETAPSRRARCASLVTLLLAAGWLAGCGDAFETGDNASSSTGGHVTPSSCVPNNLEGSAGLASSCGVFVDASGGADDADGGSATPLRSLGKALEVAAGRPIYVCAASDAAVAGATLSGAQDIFGGLECGSWTYSGTPSAVLGPADLPALRVAVGVAVRLEDLQLTAPTAIAQGASSIALLSEGDVTLARVRLAAGDGAQGQDGEDGGDLVPTPLSMDGLIGSSADTPPSESEAGSNECDGAPLAGGAGGEGGDNDKSNKDGGSGVKGDLEIGDSGGAAGDGQVYMDASWQCITGEGMAFPGDAGMSGQPGAQGSGLGTLTSTGFTGRDGVDGKKASHGSSGGGGGGSAASGAVSGPHGAGGGGGGAGGCAGKAGRGGGTGGSSLPLVALSGSLKLDGVELAVGTAGHGGKGGKGQLGQEGGAGGPGGDNGGTPLKDGCGGGPGGRGGHGGDAGGGAGGHAIGLAQAAEVSVDGTPQVDLGGVEAAKGGKGGDGTETPASAGDDGIVIATQIF